MDPRQEYTRAFQVYCYGQKHVIKTTVDGHIKLCNHPGKNFELIAIENKLLEDKSQSVCGFVAATMRASPNDDFTIDPFLLGGAPVASAALADAIRICRRKRQSRQLLNAKEATTEYTIKGRVVGKYINKLLTILRFNLTVITNVATNSPKSHIIGDFLYLNCSNWLDAYRNKITTVYSYEEPRKTLVLSIEKHDADRPIVTAIRWARLVGGGLSPIGYIVQKAQLKRMPAIFSPVGNWKIERWL